MVRVVDQESPFEAMTGTVVSVNGGAVETQLDVFGMPTAKSLRAHELEVLSGAKEQQGRQSG
jgi:transcription antitermination factor NusG